MGSNISVIITTKNRIKLLERAVNSVFNQSLLPDELIIVDDGSNDHSSDFVSNLFHKSVEIHLIKNLESKGACAARNQGIKLSSSKFLALLDDDDEFDEKRLEVLKYNYCEKYSFIASEAKIVERNKTVRRRKIVKLSHMVPNNAIGSPIFVEKGRIEKIGGFDVTLPSSQDWDMWYRLIKEFGPAEIVSQPLYLIHEDNIPRITTGSNRYIGKQESYNKHKNDFNEIQKLLFRIKILKMKGDEISFVKKIIYKSFMFFEVLSEKISRFIR